MGTGRTGVVVLAVVGLLALSSCTPSRSTAARRNSAPAPVAPSPVAAPSMPPTTATPPPVTAPSTTSPISTAGWPSTLVVGTGMNDVTDLNPTPGAVYALDDTPGDGESGADDTPLRYDLATHGVLFGASITGPGTMTVTGGWAWVAANDPSGAADVTVYRLDLHDLSVVATQDVGATNVGPLGQDGLRPPVTATVHGPLWVAAGSTLYALSTTTGTVLFKVQTTTTIVSLSTSPDGTVLYAAGESTRFPLVLDELDARTGRLLASESESDSVAGGEVAATDTGVWVSFRTGLQGVTVQHDKATLAIVTNQSERAGSTGYDPFVEIMGQQANVSDGVLWLAGSQGLACADPFTGALRTIEPPVSSLIVSVVAQDGVLYGAGDGGLSIISAPRACFG